MRLYDTLTREQRPLTPLGDAVTLYVCGITPYDTTHLGHAFLNVVYDTLVRALRWRGQAVRYVQNVTDIDDDILRKAREVGMPWDELGRQETDRYLADLAALNCLKPDVYARATNEIPRMIELIERLIAEGLAYERDGWVYFHVASDPGFGQLAAAAGYSGYETWLKTANERGNTPNDPRKRDPLDFVLWQSQQPGEPGWESPWGLGRPGWHIECSAMSTRYLGPRLDIHGGGADLIFPHHTCEIAQSENATGERPFVQTWMHIAMVRQDDEKMSKSLGNLTRVSELLPDYTPDAIRLLLVSHHYRQEWEYHPDDMRAAAARAARLARAAALTEADGDVAASPAQPGAAAETARTEFSAALEDDLDTPRALAALETLAGAIEQGAAPGGVAALRELADVLGLRLRGIAAAPDGAATADATVARQGGVA
jgi:L-cysteine:1D-myo-inositol 2-amino-2-deoxy-alpha-D-glucopyranoside ligase